MFPKCVGVSDGATMTLQDAHLAGTHGGTAIGLRMNADLRGPSCHSGRV